MAKEVTEIVIERPEDFPQFEALVEMYQRRQYQPSVSDLLNPRMLNDRYHGPDKPWCQFVPKYKQITYTKPEPGQKIRDHKKLVVYTCLKHPHVECLRSGWEIGWWNGTNSKEL